MAQGELAHVRDRPSKRIMREDGVEMYALEKKP